MQWRERDGVNERKRGTFTHLHTLETHARRRTAHTTQHNSTAHTTQPNNTTTQQSKTPQQHNRYTNTQDRVRFARPRVRCWPGPDAPPCAQTCSSGSRATASTSVSRAVSRSSTSSLRSSWPRYLSLLRTSGNAYRLPRCVC